MQSTRRRRDIQGLRALAVLLVVAFHAGLPVPGGFTGVDVFFAISGFVITGTLLSELTSVGRIDLGRFYVRRIKRLLPALAVMLTAVTAAGTLLDPVAAQHVSVVTGVFASIFSANVYLYSLPTGYFDVSASLNPLQHTWTLGVEEQFYIVFPALLLLAWRAGGLIARCRALAATAVGGLSFPSFLVASSPLLLYGSKHLTDLVAVHGSDWPERFQFYALPTRAWEFGAGALVALLSSSRRLPAAAGSALGVAGIAAIAFGAFTLDGAADSGATSLLVPVAGACALLAAGATSNRVARALGARPLVCVGDLSYSWYLWHWPLIVFASALWPRAGWAGPAAAAVSLLPAALSFRLVENPVRFDPRIVGRRAIALAAVCIAVPLAALAGLGAAQHALAGTNAMRDWRRSQLLHADVRLGCRRPLPHDAATAARCTRLVARAKGTVVLIGDSNAGHFTEPFFEAAKQARFDSIVATRAACPFAPLRVEGTSAGAELCLGFFRSSLGALLRLRPGLVVIAARTDSYLHDANVGLARPDDRTLAYDTTRKAQLLSEGLRSALVSLSRAGIPVLLVHPLPELPIDPQGCAVVLVLREAACGAALPRSVVDRDRRQALAAEERAFAGLPEVTALDFVDELCDASTCSPVRDGLLMLRDRRHLSVAGALTLTDEFTAAILAHARRATPSGESTRREQRSPRSRESSRQPPPSRSPPPRSDRRRR